jgi:hypothetical protein
MSNIDWKKELHDAVKRAKEQHPDPRHREFTVTVFDYGSGTVTREDLEQALAESRLVLNEFVTHQPGFIEVQLTDGYKPSLLHKILKWLRQ